MEEDVLARLETRQLNPDKQPIENKEQSSLAVRRKLSQQSLGSMDIDCSCVHWGFLNICQLTSSGKKIKSAIWRTLWVDLCGTNLRLFKDKSLTLGKDRGLPPSSVVPPSQQGLQKVAFFDLKHTAVGVVNNNDVIQVKSKRLRHVYSRPHVFEICFAKINSMYVCQAPSNSSLLRWVSKIQEGIDESHSDQPIGNADERLRLAKLIVAKQHERLVDRLQEEEPSGEELDQFDEDVNEELLAGQVQLTEAEKEKLVILKRRLQDKSDLLWQLQEQESAFLGGDDERGVCSGDDFFGTLTQDHLVVPGRPSTLLKAGCQLHVFGQLPDRRWRCAGLNTDGTQCVDDENVPVIGSIPSSVILELSAKSLLRVGDEVEGRTPSSSMSSGESSESEDEEPQKRQSISSTASPYSNHRPLYIATVEKSNNVSLRSELNRRPSDSSQTTATDDRDTLTPMRPNASNIVINRRLRQVGISIVLRSSSSEGET